MIFKNNLTEQMRITSANSIGIGTNNPQSKLHLHTNSTTTNQSIQITDTNSGFTATDGFMITKELLNKFFVIDKDYKCIRINE